MSVGVTVIVNSLLIVLYKQKKFLLQLSESPTQMGISEAPFKFTQAEVDSGRAKNTIIL